ncbi:MULTISPECIES: hypothetical protein [Lentzea]|uniref:Uncharacterized protein n=2 Tax=Lentzea TaxID=165301 RepID=A0A1W2AHQ4_9PSEU|nr:MULTISPECIES: hypothetical protein [Lentzea]MDX8148013.1 hypothetical protein [Lentzea sp. BCCO 10_0061]SMC60100.1 hypothetical protein SAMN05660733_00689 [Lentzea albidocapillata]
MQIPDAATPIVCDMTDAPDTDAERLAEYRRLFTHAAFLGRERTTDGIRFRFRVEPGLEEWVRDLAAREKACCAFFAFDITIEDGEVRYDCAVTDNDQARAILEEYYALPDLLVESVDDLRERLVERGVVFTSSAAGTVHHVQPVVSGQIGG